LADVPGNVWPTEPQAMTLENSCAQCVDCVQLVLCLRVLLQKRILIAKAHLEESRIQLQQEQLKVSESAKKLQDDYQRQIACLNYEKKEIERTRFDTVAAANNRNMLSIPSGLDLCHSPDINDRYTENPFSGFDNL